MTVSNLTQPSSFEDIVFKGRNKTYGAYEIRKNYNSALAKGFFIALSLFLILFFLRHTAINAIIPLPLGPTSANILVEPPVIPFQQTSTHPPATEKKLKCKDLSHLKLSKENDNLDKRDITPISIISADRGSNDNIFADAGNTEGGLEHPFTAKLEIVPDTKAIQSFDATKLPMFPGGEEAMLRFINDHIHYPDIAIQTSGQGTVFVSFVVSAEGKVSDINIVKKAGFGFDEESVRVIAAMPNWQPGEQNGKKTNVRMVIPIKFTLK